jgi:hypothetical protein
MNYGEKHYIELGRSFSAKSAAIMRMPMWMLQKLFCSAVWTDWESMWMLYRESLGNRIKVRPPEPVGRQGKSSALVAEPGNPKIVPAIGVI